MVSLTKPLSLGMDLRVNAFILLSVPVSSPCNVTCQLTGKNSILKEDRSVNILCKTKFSFWKTQICLKYNGGCSDLEALPAM